MGSKSRGKQQPARQLGRKFKVFIVVATWAVEWRQALVNNSSLRARIALMYTVLARETFFLFLTIHLSRIIMELLIVGGHIVDRKTESVQFLFTF